MDRNLAYVVPLAVLSLAGGSLRVWNSPHPPPGAAVHLPLEPPPSEPAAPVRSREGESRLLQLKQMQGWLRQERERIEQGQAEQRRLRHQLADWEDTLRQLRRQVVLREAVIQAGAGGSAATRLSAEAGAVVPPVPDPAKISAWEERAQRLVLEGLYRQAGDAFCRALGLNPADPVLHYNLGLLSEKILGEPGRALYHYRLFLALAPEDPQAPRVRRDLERLERLGEGD